MSVRVSHASPTNTHSTGFVAAAGIIFFVVTVIVVWVLIFAIVDSVVVLYKSTRSTIELIHAQGVVFDILCTLTKEANARLTKATGLSAAIKNTFFSVLTTSLTRGKTCCGITSTPTSYSP